ncbi:MAG: hypothetical protein IJE78_05270 [Bacteroidaceae bacterium]|nr:hypothetical protein [Bacteroidaceae bacterium]
MIDEVESKRIVEITDEPVVSDDDFAVIDGPKGTRRVPLANLLVKFGVDVPDPNYGIKGMVYLKLSGGNIESVYFKTSDTTWEKLFSGGYTPVETSLSNMTWEQVAQFTWEELANFTW